MQTVSTAFANAYDTAPALKARARVFIEWNWNRYEQNPVATDGGVVVDPKDESETFPISSIIAPNRPDRRGIFKARVGEAKLPTNADRFGQYSLRLVSKAAEYKYWSTTTQSTPAITANPQVMYSTNVYANKIVIGLENTWASPSAGTIQVSTNGSSFTSVATLTAGMINSNGQIILYRQANGTWSTTVHRGAPANIRGVRFAVTAMDRASSHLNVIEISARLEQEFSDEVYSVAVSKSLGETDIIRPLGDMDANTGTLVLDNSHGLYNNDNGSSVYQRLIRKYAKVTIDYGLDAASTGAGDQYVNQGVFYTDVWQEDPDNLSVTVSLFDHTVFWQNTQMQEVLFQNKTAAEIIREILIMQGFNKFDRRIHANQVDTVIPYVWFNAETTVWDAIKEVAEADQGTGYIDEAGFFVYFSREYMNLISGTVNYTLQSLPMDGKLPNIETLNENFENATNSVVVQYTERKRDERTAWRAATNQEIASRDPDRVRFTDERGLNYYTIEYTEPNYPVVWEAEGSVVLSSSRIVQNVGLTDDSIFIAQDDAAVWPYSGYVNIQGETMKYDGKYYFYYPESGGSAVAILHSQDEKNKYDRLTHPNMRHLNKFSGELAGIERAQIGTSAQTHTIGITGWTDTHYWDRNSNTFSYIPGYSNHNVQRGTMELKAPGYAQNNTVTMIPKVQPVGAGPKKYPGYGAIVIFRKNTRARNSAGLMVHWDSAAKKGIFIELNTTDFVNSLGGSIGTVRGLYHNGFARQEASAGVQIPIDYNVPYEVEARWTGSKLGVYINGNYVMTIPVRQWGAPESGDWGPFVVGPTTAEFDALYFYTKDSDRTDDQSGFYHKIKGGFQSDTSRSHAYARQESGQITDWRISEFSPVAHEVREFDVSHDPFPVLSTRIFNTNTWNSFILSHYSNAFRSKFMIANASRGAAILNGDDPSIYGTDQVIGQKLIVEGSVIVSSEEESRAEFKNEAGIRTNGKIELTFDNKWIQTEIQAERVGKFIVDKWGDVVDTIEVEGIFTPALQLGDTVSVHYPDKKYNQSTHRYSVIALNFDYTGPMTSTMTLRRIR